MRTVARREALRVAESKRFAVINENTLANQPTNSSAQWAIKSVFSQLQTGALSYQVVGNEIQHPLLKLKFVCRGDFGAIRADQPINYGTIAFNVMLIATNDARFSAGVGTSFTNTSLISGFDWFYQQSGYYPTMNGNNVKVLKRWHRKVTPDQTTVSTAGGSFTISGSLKYRWKRKLTYEDAAGAPGVGGPTRSTELRGWNYWILVGHQVTTNYASALTAPPIIVMDSFLYYKDP